MRIGDWLIKAGLGVVMATSGHRAFASLLHSAEDPVRAQQRTLRRILTSLAPTAFGRALAFEGTDSVDAFRRRTPIHDYEALRPWIERQIAGEAGAISPTQPLMYARTSGTTGAAKLVPVTGEVLRGLKRAQRVMAYAQHQYANIFAGKILAIGGALREVTLPDGTPGGAITGLIYRSMPQLLRAKYILPAEVFAIEETELKYRTILRLALQHRDVSAIVTANPSTVLRLVETLNQNAAELVAELESGMFSASARLPSDQADVVRAALRPAPDQASAIALTLKRNGQLRLADPWPALRAVVTWTQGSCALAANAVVPQLPNGTRLIEAGYVASEMRGTVIVDPERGLGLPLIDDVFYEFVPVEAWDAGSRETLLLHQIEPGRDYHILVTTAAGLVRYFMNDVIRATELVRATPTLVFLRKGRGVTNITGEKLAEDQVAAAVQRLAAEFSLEVPFYVVLADDETAGYIAYMQVRGANADPAALAASLEYTLSELNIEYAAKRKTGRLKPLSVILLSPDAAVAYRRQLVAKGQREAQLKVLALQRKQDCDFDFRRFAADA